MGWLTTLLSGVATLLLFWTGQTILVIVAIVATVGCFWSWGIMHNHATDMAKRRSNYTGGFYDITHQEAESVPNWITIVNMLFSLAGLALFIAGIVTMVRR